ncbi:MAG: ImmA/IrrE family metallo-endopeptidase [Roseburia sp.]|nr:ImmA/IrrE family metallo-endopeptidase [Roseburia sp.]
MTKYEALLNDAERENVEVVETTHFSGTRIKGLYLDNHIAISKDLKTEHEKICVLAEELGHHETATGDIIDQSTVENRKQEMRGRIIAYNRLVGLRGIVNAYNHHCQGLSEVAEFLGVTEEFLNDALSYYRNKYGVCTTVDNYAIIFEPAIAVLELI